MQNRFTNEKCSHDQKVGETNVEGTNHKGSMTLLNDWGSDLYSVTIRHRRGNDPTRQEEKTFYNVTAGSLLGPVDITYTTGIGSPFDYWWVKVVLPSGVVYQCKDSFYCYIDSSDDGKVKLRIDGEDRQLYVSFSKSSGCTVDLLVSPGEENNII